MPDGVRPHGRCALYAFALTACTSLALAETGGRGPAVAYWRNPPPRAPRPLAPGCSGSGLTRRRWAGARARQPGSAGRLPAPAHAASFPSAIQAVGIGIMLEDVGAVSAAETLDMVGLALSPRDPPGSPGALLRRGPLRTERATLTALGSSKPQGRRGPCC